MNRLQLQRALVWIGLFLAPLVLTGAVIRGGGGGGATPSMDATHDVGNTMTGADENNPVEIFGSGVQDDRGWRIYRHSNGTSVIACLETAGENNCDYFRQLDAGFNFGVKDSAGNILFQVAEATGAFTYHDERHFRVATCQNATASIVFDTPTSNAPTAACDTGTNTQKGYLEFDTTTDESFQDSFILPAGFTTNGAIDVHFRWKAAAITGSVAWCGQLVRVDDGETSDPAFPAQAVGNCVSDTAKGTTLQENEATITGATCTSCVAGDHVYVRISRDPDETSTRTDDMAGDALLLAYGRTIRMGS